jgi:hypothetical protein
MGVGVDVGSRVGVRVVSGPGVIVGVEDKHPLIEKVTRKSRKAETIFRLIQASRGCDLPCLCRSALIILEKIISND